MRITLNRSSIEVVLGDVNGLSVTEQVLPVDALRYAKTLKQLAEQLIEEFPNDEKEEVIGCG